MASKTKPHSRSYFEATRNFTDGSDTPRAFLDRCIEDIERLDENVGAFVVTGFDAARAAAEDSTTRWASGNQISPLDGMPIGVKDIMETAAFPTEQGRVGRACSRVLLTVLVRAPLTRASAPPPRWCPPGRVGVPKRPPRPRILLVH